MGERRISEAICRIAAVVPAVIVVGSLTASPANAATVVGSTFPATGGCTAGYTYIETFPVPGTSYTVPSNGVLTSWVFDAGPTPPQVKFKVFRPAGDVFYTVVGASVTATPIPSVTNTYQIRLPVRAGDILGLTAVTAGGCNKSGGVIAYATSDTAVGSTQAYAPGGGTYDISAALEADSDGDGYGDETQDGCPSQATTQGACDRTAPVAELTAGPTKTTKSTVKFKFGSDDPGATFQCKLKGKNVTSIQQKNYRPCSSPVKFKHLAPGTYKVYVFATDAVGNVGTPVKQKFVVQPKK